MELKTLNDLQQTFPMNCSGGGFISKDELKQEAIKWVKRNRNPIYVELGEREFMKFHNISEEDLKGDKS